MSWTTDKLPSQSGKVAVITGASSGIGIEIARVMTARGAHVIMPVRNREKGEGVADRLRNETPGAEVTVTSLDLSRLASVEAFAEELHHTVSQVDLLINNAGLGADKPARTADGFGLEVGVNHLGHFALTGRLLDMIARPGGRVVTMSSQVQQNSKLDPETFHDQDSGMYGPSKLANLLFAVELQRRLDAAGVPVLSLAAHPGASRTPGAQEGIGNMKNPIVRLLSGLFINYVMQEPAAGALPALRAATDPDAQGGQYYGPNGLFGLRGAPALVKLSGSAADPDLARRVWERSVTLTGVDYSMLASGGLSSTGQMP